MNENNQIDDNTSQEEKEPRKIEVVPGNGNLNISPVYEHIEVEKPKQKKNVTILIPEVKETVNRTKEDSNTDTSQDDETFEDNSTNK